MATPDIYLLMHGEIAVGTCWPRADGTLQVSFDQCTFLALGEDAKIDGGQLALTFTLQATSLNPDEPEVPSGLGEPHIDDDGKP